MTDIEARERLIPQIREVFEGRVARWSAPSPCDYDGRERALDVFDADAAEQRDLLRRFRAIRPAVEAAAGGPVIVIFHTRKETARLYAKEITP